MTFLFERAPGVSKEVGDWSATVREAGGMDPQTVIKSNQAWEILVEFEEGGVAQIPGNWVVDAYVESIGPGAEMRWVLDPVCLIRAQHTTSLSLLRLALYR